ncbi:META domain-containing protein [Leifsonia poae]|uniref:META domain-containing protein n=1 Tax=Leifsonia poae TaxID=110933 RepID=UPI003D674F3A
MRTVRIAALVLAISAAATLSGCSSGTSADSPGPTATSFPSPSAGASAGDFAGAWGEDAAGKPSLTIADDGAFNGTDGCNSFAGTGTLKGDKFDFGTFASTLMACEGVDTWLIHVSTATVADDELTIFNAAGTEIGKLDKR